ncbi:hypothetical protein [uncultured Ramlibacter sp.]|uniref:hypothetical protein n=1 Tax=uncultured Ramlibacter sp. TaxID=260755 RepID=UPI002633F68B|nr:hypothetical protein [uncultured Ramlibacter sp.]
MSLFSWLTKKKKARNASAPESSGLSRMDATRPVSSKRGAKDAHPANNAQPANRKNERMARRELLYTVVREAMMRSGVLSASYKFKVLSLDARGRQFLVMVDLSREHSGEASRLAEIEALIAQAAKSRYDILVTSVYWRMNEHVAVGVPGARPRPTSSQPIPLDSHNDSQPAVLDSAPSPLSPAQPRSPYEPIDADEVAAFKQALAAGIARPAAAAKKAASRKPSAEEHQSAAGASARAFDGSGKHGPQSYTLLTGFEDTEMPDAETRQPALSGTQYGDLH